MLTINRINDLSQSMKFPTFIFEEFFVYDQNLLNYNFLNKQSHLHVANMMVEESIFQLGKANLKYLKEKEMKHVKICHYFLPFKKKCFRSENMSVQGPFKKMNTISAISIKNQIDVNSPTTLHRKKFHCRFRFISWSEN